MAVWSSLELLYDLLEGVPPPHMEVFVLGRCFASPVVPGLIAQNIMETANLIVIPARCMKFLKRFKSIVFPRKGYPAPSKYLS